MKTYGGVVV